MLRDDFMIGHAVLEHAVQNQAMLEHVWIWHS